MTRYETLSDVAAKLERYAVAKQLADEALAIARDARDSDLAKRLDQRSKGFAQLGIVFDDMKKQVKSLEANPDDRVANKVVGRYLCFVCGVWGTGLPCLAKGDDSRLSDLAKLELTRASSPAGR